MQIGKKKLGVTRHNREPRREKGPGATLSRKKKSVLLSVFDVGVNAYNIITIDKVRGE